MTPSTTPAAAGSTGPLDGIVVIDASNFVFGPVATQMLGDLGADVIKIEPPEGDPTRGIGAMKSDRMGSFFLNLNRNKRSVVLDLKDAAGRTALLGLLQQADVFVHNMRDSAIRRLGLDAATLMAANPGLIVATAQGFGAGGPYFDRPAYDDVIQGLGGLPGLNAEATGQPSYIPMLFTDKLCGIYLSTAISSALVQRGRTGRGQAVTVPMFETTAAFTLLEHLADGVFAEPPTQAQRPIGYPRALSPQHRPLRTRDGHLCVVANTDAQWARLFATVGRPELADDPRFRTIGLRMRHGAELFAAIDAALDARTTDEWLAALHAADIPAAPVHDLPALRNDPHLARTGFYETWPHASEGPLVMPRNPIEFGATTDRPRRGAPRLGEHTREVLAAAGLDTRTGRAPTTDSN